MGGGRPRLPRTGSHTLAPRPFRFLAPWVKVPLALASFPFLHLSNAFKVLIFPLPFPLPLPAPNRSIRQSHQCSLLNVFTGFPPGPAHRLCHLDPGVPASAPQYILHQQPGGRGGICLNGRYIRSFKALWWLHLIQSQVSPKILYNPARIPPTHLHSLLLPSGLLTVSQAYQTHSHLRTFALAFSLFWSDPALHICMAHTLLIFT